MATASMALSSPALAGQAMKLGSASAQGDERIRMREAAPKLKLASSSSRWYGSDPIKYLCSLSGEAPSNLTSEFPDDYGLDTAGLH